MVNDEILKQFVSEVQNAVETETKIVLQINAGILDGKDSFYIDDYNYGEDSLLLFSGNKIVSIELGPDTEVTYDEVTQEYLFTLMKDSDFEKCLSITFV